MVDGGRGENQDTTLALFSLFPHSSRSQFFSRSVSSSLSFPSLCCLALTPFSICPCLLSLFSPFLFIPRFLLLPLLPLSLSFSLSVFHSVFLSAPFFPHSLCLALSPLSPLSLHLPFILSFFLPPSLPISTHQTAHTHTHTHTRTD